ncbi:MAG: zinc metalloprotease [Actinomycetes bacterium]
MIRLRTVSAAAAAVVAMSGLVSPVATVALASGAAEELCVDEDAREIAANARMADGSRSGALDHREVGAAEAAAIEQRTQQILGQRGRAPAQSVTVPTFVHVMASSSGEGTVTDKQIRDQIAALNRTFGGTESPAAAKTGFTFELVGTKTYFEDRWHLDRQSRGYRSVTRVGGPETLNIWLVDFVYLGMATFPWDYEKDPAVDGVRVHYGSLPGGVLKYYDEGKTATHEVGHWLGLYHVFQGGCTGEGDYVADTPPQGTPSYECPLGKDSCEGDGPDSVTNYMDYSDDFCYDRFTADQSTRMGGHWTAYRAA